MLPEGFVTSYNVRFEQIKLQTQTTRSVDCIESEKKKKTTFKVQSFQLFLIK